MQLFRIPISLLCLLTLTRYPQSSTAIALSPADESLRLDEASLEKRCDKPCGFYSQVCCGANEVCFTDGNNEARCGVVQGSQQTGQPAAGNPGNWQYYTTTYVMTDLQTITTTYSSYFAATTQNDVVPSNCQYALGEVPCGSTCCSSGQYCMTDVNKCAAAGGGGSSGYYSSFYTVTQIASAPIRPTSNTVLTVTSTGAPTATVPYSAPVGTDGSTLIGAEPQTQGGGLSAGAIAGIVIGVIAAIIILILICLCCCAKGLLDTILGIFTGKRRRTETTYIEERHSHHGSRPAGRTWFGARPSRPDRTEKKSSGLAGFAKVGGALAVLGVALGLKRNHDRKHEAKSSSSYSYYDDSYTGTSESEYHCHEI